MRRRASSFKDAERRAVYSSAQQAARTILCAAARVAHMMLRNAMRCADVMARAAAQLPRCRCARGFRAHAIAYVCRHGYAICYLLFFDYVDTLRCLRQLFITPLSMLITLIRYAYALRHFSPCRAVLHIDDFLRQRATLRLLMRYAQKRWLMPLLLPAALRRELRREPC